MDNWVLRTTDEDVAAALQAAALEPDDPRIVKATYHSEPGLDLFVLDLSDGRRLVFPRENLQHVASATREQAADFFIGQFGDFIWWPQQDEGLRLENLLEGRTGNEKWMERLKRQGVAA